MMDSARYFDLLGESVPQVRVSACTLALLGFINFYIYIKREIGVEPDLNLRRQPLAARSSQMVTAKPLGHLVKTGIVANFVTLALYDSKSGGTQSPPIQYGR